LVYIINQRAYFFIIKNGGFGGVKHPLVGLARVKTGKREYKIYNSNAILICCGICG
jgi:hypothetical protein